MTNYIDLKKIDLIINVSNDYDILPLRVADNCFMVNLFNPFYINDLLTLNILYIIKNSKNLL